MHSMDIRSIELNCMTIMPEKNIRKIRTVVCIPIPVTRNRSTQIYLRIPNLLPAPDSRGMAALKTNLKEAEHENYYKRLPAKKYRSSHSEHIKQNTTIPAVHHIALHLLRRPVRIVSLIWPFAVLYHVNTFWLLPLPSHAEKKKENKTI